MFGSIEFSSDMQNNPAGEESAADRQFATTLSRGLDLLRCFSPERPVLGNRDLAQITGLPKATVSRFTYTLTRLGYLCTEPGGHRYQLGSAVLSLAYPLLASMSLRQRFRPAMHEFADVVQGSVSLGIRDRLSIVYVETARARSVYSTRMAEVGLSHPIIASAIGRAYLSACTESEREATINEIKVKAPDLWERYQGQLDLSLSEYRKKNFCYSYGDLRPDIYAVATALRRSPNSDILVLNCVMQSFQVTEGELESTIGPRLVALAATLDGFAPV